MFLHTVTHQKESYVKEVAISASHHAPSPLPSDDRFMSLLSTVPYLSLIHLVQVFYHIVFYIQ